MAESRDLNVAMQHGEVSLDQAAEIARAEESAPGAAKELLKVAQKESFAVFKEKARAAKLEAEQHRGLAQRQRESRCGRSHVDPLGMVNLYLRFEPHVGTPIVARAETEARRLYKAAKRTGEQEPFERHLADAYAKLLRGSGKASTTRPELVVLVSHEVVKRGWKDVRKGELCKIPGVGPVAPQVAKDIASDAFLTGVFYDGTDLRHMRRWTRNIPVEVRLALELGAPPDFDGLRCERCGHRFRTEIDHLEPHCRGGPASTGNLEPSVTRATKSRPRRTAETASSGPANPDEHRDHQHERKPRDLRTVGLSPGVAPAAGHRRAGKIQALPKPDSGSLIRDGR
jgi:hypothetical protein